MQKHKPRPAARKNAGANRARTPGPIRVTAGIWWVGCGDWDGRTPTLSTIHSSNSFLIGRARNFALVDVGQADAVAPVLANAARAGARLEWIRTVLLTHSHSDHTAGLAGLIEKTKATVAASALTAQALAGDPAARRLLDFHLPGSISTRKVLKDGDTVKLGPFTFKVLHTPGHIPDAITLVGRIGKELVMITGDTAMGDQGDAIGGIGWLDARWHSRPRVYLKTIERLQGIPADILLPGHGHPIIGRKRIAISLQHCRERLNQFLAINALPGMFPLDFSE
jgi:glyoxylase-like metal-dependent hydrolase (beta-lactamase superfamily II)